MIDFPQIDNPSQIEVKIIIPRWSTSAEDGKVYSRVKFTEPKREFNLSWQALPFQQFQTLESFFANSQGKLINYTNYLNSNTYTVILGDDLLQGQTSGAFDSNGSNCMTTAIKLSEV